MNPTQRESAADQRPERKDPKRDDRSPPAAPVEPDPAEGANDVPPPNPGSPAG
ncbi:MAG TPA: hypothetical protein VFT56_00620 [Sphingomonas sp.]|nr:hypothetical protein [Sphingomonas sp.]